MPGRRPVSSKGIGILPGAYDFIYHWLRQCRHEQRIQSSTMAAANTFAFTGIEAVPVEVQVQIAPGTAGLCWWDCRTRRWRGAGAGPRRVRRHGCVAAAQTSADQS